MSSLRSNARMFGLRLAFGVMLATAPLAAPAWAQVEIGSNTNITMNGDIGFGYTGSYSSLETSTHGTSVNGDGTLSGYYYNPKFLNFFFDPVYNRSQANSGQGSITSATSLSAGVNLFSGSHFPGSVSYGESFNSSGNYGFGTTPGFTTTGRSRSFGVGWSELIPNLPPLHVLYSQTASTSSIFGTNEEDRSGTKNLNLFSNYKLDGWYMGARFTDTWTHTELPAVVTGGETITGDTNGKSFSFNANHKLPLRGNFGGSYTWSDFSGEADGIATTGSNQMISGSASFVPTSRLSTSFLVNYDSNLQGAIEQQLIGSGVVNPQVNLGTSSYSISLSNYDNLVITKSLSAGFGVGHIQQVVYGRTIEATHFSGIVNYRFLKPLWGALVVYAGVNDLVTETGNQGAGLVTGASFSKKINGFDLGASFGYSQDTETVLATQVTSSYSYQASAQRRLTRRTRWIANFNGFHTGMGRQEGSSAHAESYSTNLVFKMYNVGANYGHTSGTVLLTANGLVQPPGTGILTGNQFLLDTGSTYSFSFTANPVRRMSVSTAFTRTINDATGGLTPTNSATKIFLVFTSYQFRKMTFTAGYSNLNQFISTSGQPRASYSNFYVGIQRWFKVF